MKRWFDPVTVSKIFILGKNEVTPTLQSYMEPSSIPKKYGGQLNWAWGDSPDLDQETREALERDGHKGWVKGPALWLNNKRIVVGSENGKARRSDKEIAEMKPIVYAADYTEDPVHAEKRRASAVSSQRKSLAMNGKASLDKSRSDSPNVLVEREGEAAAATAVVASASPAHTSAPAEPEPQHSAPKTALPTHLAADSIRTSPMGDSQVHLPNAQPAAPATTAEYISPTPSRQNLPTSVENHTPDVPQTDIRPTNTAAVATTVPPTQPPVEPAVVAPHPAGHTQPGPLSDHQTQINQKIANQLQGESTILIPAEANGALAHPAIVASSDNTKGLAMEEDKLALNGGLTRPQPERFVTAAEF